MKYFSLFTLSLLILSGCAVSRVQDERGAVSIENGKIYSNVTLLYSKDDLGECDIEGAIKKENNVFSIPVDNLSTNIVCGKDRKITRVIQPSIWTEKYYKTRRNAVVSSFIFGGVLGGALTAGMTSSKNSLEETPPMHRIYPPYMAVVPAGESRAKRKALNTILNEEYEFYLSNLPKDCANWNRKDFHAVCDRSTVVRLQELESIYLRTTKR